jgi:hypothetical protein
VEKWLAERKRKEECREYEVVIKKVKQQKALSLRRILPPYGHLSEMFGAMGPYLGKVRAPRSKARRYIYHDQEFKESDAHGGLAFPLWRTFRRGEFKMVELAGL